LALYYALIVTCGKKLTTIKRLNTRLQAAHSAVLQRR